jgi:hypothetical protein
MRTSNPLQSSGYYKPERRLKPGSHAPLHPVAPPLNVRSTAAEPQPALPLRTRPSHKRHPVPRLFHDHASSLRTPPKVKLSARAIANVEHALHHGWADSTLTNYGYAVDRFLAFCRLEGIPAEFQLPTDEFVLCAFAASSAGVHAGTTARNNIAALKAWHIVQGVEWKGSSRLHYVLAGVENLAPDSSKRPPRPPINATMLRVLYDGLDFSSPADVAIFAAACVAFWGQCRLGELLPVSRSPGAAKFLPTRRHISQSTRSDRATILRLPRTKTKKNGDDVLVAQKNPINPTIALNAHLTVNAIADTLPLFAYRTPTGHSILTRSKFLTRCNEIWQRAGYPRTTGHSFRIGGTTELLLAGVSPDVVKAMGRWSSDAFHKYWRSLEDLAPLHAEFLGGR